MAIIRNIEEETIDFITRINIAVRKVQKSFPQAQLYYVQCLSDQSTSDYKDLKNVQVTFGLNNNQIGIIKSETWTTFGSISVINLPLLGHIIIPWGIKFNLEDAIKLKEKLGYKDKFDSVLLSWPLHLDSKEPYYIFVNNNNFENIFVGIYTGKVFDIKSKAHDWNMNANTIMVNSKHIVNLEKAYEVYEESKLND